MSGAARICSFSSRLVIEVWRRPGGEEEEKIIVQYNDMTVRVLEGGLEQWKKDYAEALAVR